jgi:hypothetical protein
MYLGTVYVSTKFLPGWISDMAASSASSRVSKGQGYQGFLGKRAGISRLLKEKGREQF